MNFVHGFKGYWEIEMDEQTSMLLSVIILRLTLLFDTVGPCSILPSSFVQL